IGTAVCLVAQHHPLNLAKQVATLDTLSRGRFVFGIGYGWNHEEMKQHSVDPSRRRAIVREHMLAVEKLWSDDEASFEGEVVQIAPTWPWPRRGQAPRPPVFIGGAAGPTLFRHIVEYADGWVPIGGRGVRDTLPQLRQMAEEAGRDPDTIRLMITGSKP